MTLSAKDDIAKKAKSFMVSNGLEEAAGSVWADLEDAIHLRACTRKGVKTFEIHHETEVARAAFLRTMSHGKTLAEAREAAAESIKLMLAIQCKKDGNWFWVTSHPDDDLHIFWNKKKYPVRPSSELEAFRAKFPDREFRPAYYAG